METHENSVNMDPRLCVARRFEGLIESASWVEGKRAGSLLAVGLVVAVLIATGLFQTGHNGQQVLKVSQILPDISVGYWQFGGHCYHGR